MTLDLNPVLSSSSSVLTSSILSSESLRIFSNSVSISDFSVSIIDLRYTIPPLTCSSIEFRLSSMVFSRLEILSSIESYFSRIWLSPESELDFISSSRFSKTCKSRLIFSAFSISEVSEALISSNFLSNSPLSFKIISLPEFSISRLVFSKRLSSSCSFLLNNDVNSSIVFLISECLRLISLSLSRKTATVRLSVSFLISFILFSISSCISTSAPSLLNFTLSTSSRTSDISFSPQFLRLAIASLSSLVTTSRWEFVLSRSSFTASFRVIISSLVLSINCL